MYEDIGVAELLQHGLGWRYADIDADKSRSASLQIAALVGIPAKTDHLMAIPLQMGAEPAPQKSRCAADDHPHENQTIMARPPNDNPADVPSMSILMPSASRPDERAKSRAVGMDAAI